MSKRELFADLVAALDAMAEKLLGFGSVVCGEDGCCCAVGVMVSDALDLTHATDRLVARFGVDTDDVRTIWRTNDKYGRSEGNAARWTRMRAWAQHQLEACS